MHDAVHHKPSTTTRASVSGGTRTSGRAWGLDKPRPDRRFACCHTITTVTNVVADYVQDVETRIMSWIGDPEEVHSCKASHAGFSGELLTAGHALRA
jgi:hypothetical protein